MGCFNSEANMQSCGHSYSVQVCVCVCHSGRVDWHTPLKDDGGINRYCPLALSHQVCLGGGHPVKTVVKCPQKRLKLSMKLTPFIPQVLCSYVFSPSNREHMLVALAGSSPLMND